MVYIGIVVCVMYVACLCGTIDCATWKSCAITQLKCNLAMRYLVGNHVQCGCHVCYVHQVGALLASLPVTEDEEHIEGRLLDQQLAAGHAIGLPSGSFKPHSIYIYI